MNLTSEQQNKLQTWVADGASLANIQSKLAEEFGIKLSYMDTRFLLLDLNVQVQDKQEPINKKTSDDIASAPNTPKFENDDDDDDGIPADSSQDDYADVPAGSVKVEISNLARPGFAITGSVIFSDGVRAEWGITNTGRFSLESAKAGYRPTDADLQAFQLQLREMISKRGY